MHFNPICGKLKCVQFNGDTETNNGSCHRVISMMNQICFYEVACRIIFHSLFSSVLYIYYHLCDIEYFITFVPRKILLFCLLHKPLCVFRTSCFQLNQHHIILTFVDPVQRSLHTEGHAVIALRNNRYMKPTS